MKLFELFGIKHVPIRPRLPHQHQTTVNSAKPKSAVKPKKPPKPRHVRQGKVHF